MKNWAYTVTIPDVGAVSYSKAYFERPNIMNPLTAAPYTAEEIKTVADGASEGTKDYIFDLPDNAVLGMAGFWYDEDAAAAVTSHADPLIMNEKGVFFTSDGTEVASPIAVQEG